MLESHLHSVEVGAEEETVGDGGKAVIVDVMPPGSALLHLCAHDPVRLNNFVEGRACGEELEVDGSPKIN